MLTDLTPATVIVATPEQISCDLGDEAVVLQCTKGVYYGCTPVAAFIWRYVQQPRTLADITSHVMSEYDVEPQRCAADVRSLVADLVAAGLVVVKERAGTDTPNAVH